MSPVPPPPAAGASCLEAPATWLARELAALTGPALGYAFILLVCVIWVGGSFLVESLEADGLSPLLLTYVCNALFVVLLPVYVARQIHGGGLAVVGERAPPPSERRGGLELETRALHPDDAPPERERDDDDAEALLEGDRAGGARRRSPNEASSADDASSLLVKDPSSSSSPSSGGGGSLLGGSRSRAGDRGDRGDHSWASRMGLDSAEGRARARATVRAAFLIAPLWFLAQLAFNQSLALTSVTSNSILSTSSALFTFGLSVWLVGERYSRERLAAVVCYMIGAGVVAWADAPGAGSGASASASDASSSADASSSSDAASSFASTSGGPSGSTAYPDAGLGDFLTVLAAAMYAGYTAGIRYSLPDDPEVSMLLFLGALGLANLVGVGAILFVLWSVGLLPSLFAHATRARLTLAALKGLLDNVLSDYLWARAVLLTSPTTASVGLSLQIPMAAFAEWVRGGAGWADSAGRAAATAGGCALVLLGFAGVVYA